MNLPVNFSKRLHVLAALVLFSVMSACSQVPVSPVIEEETITEAPSAPASPYALPGEVAESIDLLDTESMYLWLGANGLPVIFLQQTSDEHRLSLHWYSLGGKFNLEDELLPAAQIWPELRFLSGIGQEEGIAFSDWLSARQISYQPFLFSPYGGVALEGPSQEAETLFELAVANFKAPQMSEVFLKQVIAHRRQQVNSDFESAYLNKVYQGNPRYQLAGSDLDAVTIEQLFKVQDSMSLGHSGQVVIIVGDAQVEQLTPLVEQYLVGQAIAPSQAYRHVGPIMRGIDEFSMSGSEKDLSEIRMVFATPEVTADPATRLSSELFLQVLHQELATRLAKDQQWLGQLQVLQRPASFAERQWLLHVRIKTLPGREKQAAETLQSSLNRVLADGINDAVLVESKQQLIEQLDQQSKTLAGSAAMIFDTIRVGQDFSQWDNYAAELAAIDKTQMDQLLAWFLTSSHKLLAVEKP